MNSYELSRAWWDFSFENPSKVKPVHCALHYFCIEHCNRLGWKKEFGLPTTMTKEAIGVRSYETYINALRDLQDWGFIKLIEKSKNQYSANIIALTLDVKAQGKALDKAIVKHTRKHCSITSESIGSIDKPITNNHKPLTNNQEQEIVFPFDSNEFKKQWDVWKEYKLEHFGFKYKTSMSEQAALKKLNDLAAGSEGIALQILLESIGRQWEGFFKQKNNTNGKPETERFKERVAYYQKKYGNNN